MIEITRREMERAYNDHYKAYAKLKNSSFSRFTCLFYAAECGLKSLIMKSERKETTGEIISHDFGHDLNKMLSHLRCERRLHLPKSITLQPLKKPQEQPRNIAPKELNQVWRYGVNIKDDEQMKQLVEQLDLVCLWIKEQR